MTLEDAPIGTLNLFEVNAPLPEGWMRCHGQKLRRDRYIELFEVLGTKFNGLGDCDEKHFALPELREEWDLTSEYIIKVHS